MKSFLKVVKVIAVVALVVLGVAVSNVVGFATGMPIISLAGMLATAELTHRYVYPLPAPKK